MFRVLLQENMWINETFENDLFMDSDLTEYLTEWTNMYIDMDSN